MNFQYVMAAGKWLELLSQVAPNLTRAGVLRDPTLGSKTSQFAAIQAVAPSLGIEVSPLILAMSERSSARSRASRAAEWRADRDCGRTGRSVDRNPIIALVGRHRLPAVYPERSICRGRLISYGPDQIDQFRLAAGYVDRILKGEKPADLPCSPLPSSRLVINLKTAKTLGLPCRQRCSRRADEVIE